MAFVIAFLVSALKSITLEPTMFLDGACNQAMLLFIENVQMHKICSTKLGYPEEVCKNMSNHDDVEVEVHREFSIFSFYNSILSVIPFICVLFMGAWSDIHGRKIPLVITTGSHLLYASLYLLSNWQRSWPLEILYLATFLEGLGGSNNALLAFATSYVSDISTEESRTSRVSTINSIWYLGGPMGALLGALVVRDNDFNLALGVCLICYIISFGYVVLFIKESYGPFAKESLKAKGSLQEQQHKPPTKITALQMVKDFFNVRRVLESFKTLFVKREGRARLILIAIVSSNMIRRVARCFFMYMFTRRVLQWEAHDYGFWSTYRNTIAATASLVLVPLFCKFFTLSDSSLVLLGTSSLIFEYISYGLVRSSSDWMFMWIGPIVGILANTTIMACRSMPTKLVTSAEKGRISAMTSALNTLMPLVGYSLFSPIYYQTVDQFPSAQFFFAATLIAVIFVTFTPTKPVVYGNLLENRMLSLRPRKRWCDNINEALRNIGSSLQQVLQERHHDDCTDWRRLMQTDRST
ncbi:lysosomal proton-coupled steroid conjugate and bile acid symporter SLC46A3-like [Oratosquilla oratoria]|uniref:lysosomal proton-coupled steroid conjugate and bile acid symporter SLC46A3-like n=1 Tax=Oratosquilla oratoria TaxID=337810 RepID=UPI003F76F0DB